MLSPGPAPNLRHHAPTPFGGQNHTPAPQGSLHHATPHRHAPEGERYEAESTTPPPQMHAPKEEFSSNPPTMCTMWAYCLLNLQQLTCTPLLPAAPSLRRRLQTPTALRRPTSNTPPPPTAASITPPALQARDPRPDQRQQEPQQ